MRHLIRKIYNWFEQRTTSAEMEDAINHVLTADTIADAVSKPYITEEGALNLSAVWACVRILSETVGTLPVHLYQRTAQGRERQYKHPCRRLLQQPNSYSNRFDLMHHLMVSTALWGNGYVRIHRDMLCRPQRLELLHPMNVEPVLTTNHLFCPIIVLVLFGYASEPCVWVKLGIPILCLYVYLQSTDRV